MEDLQPQTIKHLFNEFGKKIESLEKTVENGFKDTGNRLTKLELWRSYLGGAMAVLTILVIPIALKYIAQIVEAYFK